MNTNESKLALLGAMLIAATVATAQPATTAAPAASGQQLQRQQVDEHLMRMQALHEKMQGAKTPSERRQLMAEQRKEMQTGMAMMHGIGGMQGMGGMPGGAGMMGHSGVGTNAGPTLETMQQQMNLMTQMMQSMMDQQGMGMHQGSPAAK